jgi:hypothetical protein
MSQTLITEYVKAVKNAFLSGSSSVVLFEIPATDSQMSSKYLNFKGLRRFFAQFASDFWEYRFRASEMQEAVRIALQAEGFHPKWVQRNDLEGYEPPIASLYIWQTPDLLYITADVTV